MASSLSVVFCMARHLKSLKTFWVYGQFFLWLSTRYQWWVDTNSLKYYMKKKYFQAQVLGKCRVISLCHSFTHPLHLHLYKALQVGHIKEHDSSDGRAVDYKLGGPEFKSPLWIQ